MRRRTSACIVRMLERSGPVMMKPPPVIFNALLSLPAFRAPFSKAGRTTCRTYSGEVRLWSIRPSETSPAT